MFPISHETIYRLAKCILVRIIMYSLRPKMIVPIPILARLRPAHHCPSSFKYDTWNKMQQLLRNTPKSCGVANLVDDDYDSKIARCRKSSWCHLINHKDTGHSIWDKISRNKDNHFGTEGVQCKYMWLNAYKTFVCLFTYLFACLIFKGGHQLNFIQQPLHCGQTQRLEGGRQWNFDNHIP